MAYCKKCGAYIPIGETACPACGYDPEEEQRQAQAAQAKAAEEERQRQEEREAEEKKRREAEKRAEQERTWAQREREREERQRQSWSRDPRQSQGYGGGAAQSQYTSQRTGQSGTQSQYTSQRTDTWTPPWQESQNHSNAGRVDYDQRSRARAEDSVANQSLSILSYLGPLFLIPLLTRPHDDFARYHANQGLILFLLNGLVSVLAGGSGVLAAGGFFFSLYCAIKGISNVLKGKKEPLPLIGKLRLLK